MIQRYFVSERLAVILFLFCILMTLFADLTNKVSLVLLTVRNVFNYSAKSA